MWQCAADGRPKSLSHQQYVRLYVMKGIDSAFNTKDPGFGTARYTTVPFLPADASTRGRGSSSFNGHQSSAGVEVENINRTIKLWTLQR